MNSNVKQIRIYFAILFKPPGKETKKLKKIPNRSMKLHPLYIFTSKPSPIEIRLYTRVTSKPIILRIWADE
tara:strand:- start:394 stop:606 length:213 start_codon:yes stop_codon:yes gene_type:complete